MSRTVFRVLALALMLLLPLQGMASVVAGQCMAFGHHEDAQAQEEHHAHDGAEGHHHDSQEHSSGEKKSSHCGPCTACCASASIAGPNWPLILPSPSNSQYFFAQFPPLGIPPQEFFRPPLAA